MAQIAIPWHKCYDLSMAVQQTSMNISLPESMREWIEERVATEGYGTASEYLRALVREDQKRTAREELERKLADALDSGEATEMTQADWAQIRSAVRERLKAKSNERATK
jgi:antitoxin ParD1/3/4